MPIYEYRCEKCGHRFERWQKMSDPDPKRCPECRAARVQRLISPVGFRLKGGGWYETDFKQKNRHNIAGDGGAPEKKKTEAASGGAKQEKSAGKRSGKQEGASGNNGKKSATKTGEAV